MAALTQEQVTELIVEAFIDLIQERKVAGKKELAATRETIANWLSARTGLRISVDHVQTLTTAMRQAGLLNVGGFGIGKPNTYNTTEDDMGIEAFWNQVAAFLTVWQHPSRRTMLSE
jgi:hypothetical protein